MEQNKNKNKNNKNIDINININTNNSNLNQNQKRKTNTKFEEIKIEKENSKEKEKEENPKNIQQDLKAFFQLKIKKEEKENNNNKNISLQKNWEEKNSVLIKDFNTKPSNKIIGIDMDDTLIKPKSGCSFPNSRNDWKFLYEREIILKKLQDYTNDGYKIAIFTNQKGISLGKIPEIDITGKIDDIQKDLDIPFMAFIAKSGGFYRKPSIGMWNLLQNDYNDNIIIDRENSLFIGDAAGRSKNSRGKKDHSYADYFFALNNKIKFLIPEAFFLGEKNILGEIKFNPRKFLKENFNNNNNYKDKDKDKEPNKALVTIFNNLPGVKDLIIFCGSPGSGKTNFYFNNLKKLGYEHVNQDQLKSEQKCLKKAEEYLKEGKGICIDSTNPTKEKRKAFIDLARKMNVTIRCFYFDYEKDLVFHLNNLREINPYRNNYTKSVADVVIHTWFKKLEKPQKNEGFQELENIEFIPGPFENKEDEEIFYMFQ